MERDIIRLITKFTEPSDEKLCDCKSKRVCKRRGKNWWLPYGLPLINADGSIEQISVCKLAINYCSTANKVINVK